MNVAYVLLYLQRLERDRRYLVCLLRYPIPSSVADVANHSCHFPAEPTCRHTPLNSHRQLVQVGTKDGIYLQFSAQNTVSIW